MKKRVAFYTFGCRLNQAETAVMRQGFDAQRYDLVDVHDQPDLVVVNTCTVTENGDARTRQLANKVRRINPQVRIALVGCQAQVQKDKLLALPNVRWVVGNDRKMEIADIIRHSTGDTPEVITSTIRRDSFTIPFVGFDHQHTRANLKIQDGCDFFCTFCEIPYARGRARSRQFDDLCNEARQLAAAGHHELILTGINIGTYANDGKTMVDVINALETIDDLWRIRIASIEPTTIARAIVRRMAEGGKLCRFLHIPIQSGNDTILTAMKRKYTVAEFSEFLMYAHDTVPGICLGTDVIVGFPGETDALFEETYQLLLDLPFAYLHVFSYSDRDHARSSQSDDALKIPREVIAERSRRLRELSERKRRIYHQQFVGESVTVLFEHQKRGMWSGLTDTYVRVRVPANGETLANQLRTVQLTGGNHQSMQGNLQPLT